MGHDKLLQKLEKMLETEDFPQAILLQGPGGMGKTSILKKLAKFMQSSVNEEKINLDTMILENTDEAIKIETIRKAKEFMQLSKQGDYKICIIKNIERMTIPAANSFLKILEEPPEKAVFLLSSSDPGSLLETVVSRCRIFNCQKLGESDVFEALKMHFPDREHKLEELRSLANLSLGEAISILREENSIYHKHFQIIDELFTSNLTQLMARAEELAEENRTETIRFLQLFLRYAHKKSGSSLDLMKLASIQKSINLIKQNANQRLTLEVLFLQYFANLANI